jgi:RNA polymerase sigma factor (sigma-70 family)
MEAVEGAKVATDGAVRRSPARLVSASLRVLPDERLANLAADGNQAAFAAIYERHHQALYRYCRTITRNDEDARDALQATMLKAMKALDTKPKKVRAWLYRIAHNESISILRSGKRNATDSLGDVEPAAEAPLEQRRELRQLLDDIGHLSDRQRQALVMRELGGLSYDEVGAALACSPAAAKQAAFDARTALHELAEARDTDCESIRKRISDGDRRMLRARGVRAHLRACDPCRRFDAALRTRRTKLAGLAPALSPAASAAILQSVLGGAGATGAAAGAATVGGSAAAIGGGAAIATGGGAVGGGIAMKGVIAGVVALVATGGAIAIKEERDANRADGSGAGAVEAREATTDPAAAERAGSPAAAAASGAEAEGADTEAGAGNGAAGASSNGNGNAQGATHTGSANGQGAANGQAQAGGPPPGTHPQGARPPGQHPGSRPPGTHSPQPGGHRPPPPGGGPAGGGGSTPPGGGGGGGTRPPGGSQPPPGDGTAGTRPPDSNPPPTGEATTGSTRPPRPQSTDGANATTG